MAEYFLVKYDVFDSLLSFSGIAKLNKVLHRGNELIDLTNLLNGIVLILGDGNQNSLEL